MAYLDQLDRVRRALKKLENLGTVIATENVTIPADKQMDYVDALHAYFQYAWHLKDWIKNDDAAPATLRAAVRRMETEQDWINSLMLCADVANGSKHFRLTRNSRLDAKMQAQIMIRIVDQVFDKNQGSTSVGFSYQIVEPSGTTYDALDLARQSLSDWENLITSNGGTI